MESAYIGSPFTVRASILNQSILMCRKNLLSNEWISITSSRNGLQSNSVCCVRHQKESKLNYKKHGLIDAAEVREWESGKSIDDIAARQGIKIRRHRPASDSPRNILEQIIWDKAVEVSEMKKLKPLNLVEEAISKAHPTKDFIGALEASYQRTGFPALIAEVKKASPSRGVLREDFDPVQVAKAYEQNGASCLSVLTDKKFFQGGFENLEAIHKAGVKCPLLCKEFIIETWQIYYARACGADAVLLIAAVLPDIDIKLMTMICNDLGLAALIEVHDEREMDRVLAIDGVRLIGINNRDLGTFHVDIANTKRLLEGDRGEIIRQKNIIVVGESGLFTPEDISYVQNAGVKAVLVGESLIKQEDPGKAISGLFGRDISE